jgi:hypothetical protein
MAFGNKVHKGFGGCIAAVARERMSIFCNKSMNPRANDNFYILLISVTRARDPHLFQPWN